MTMPPGRPLKDERMYYSDEHRYLLAFCATKANRFLGYEFHFTVDPEELMEQGWWQCLRRRPPGQLKPAVKHTIHAMIRWAISFYLLHGLGSTEPQDWIENHESDHCLAAWWAAIRKDDGSSAEDRAEANEIAEILRALLPATFPDSLAMLGEGYTSTELAQQQHVSGQAIRNRRDQFLRDARKLLQDQTARGYKKP
jgi:hypothetical protein